MLARALWAFVRSKPYRRAVFQGMNLTEAFTRCSWIDAGARVRPQEHLHLVSQPTPPMVNIIVPTILAKAIERHSAAFSLAGAIARTGVPLRIVVAEELSVQEELHFRKVLQSRFGAPQAAQGRIEIMDGRSGLLPVARASGFIAADRRSARLLRDAIRRRGAEQGFYRLVQDGNCDLANERPILGGARTTFIVSADFANANSNEMAKLERGQALVYTHRMGATVNPAYDFDDVAGQMASEFRARLTTLASGQNETPHFSRQSAYGLGYRVLKAPSRNLAGRRVCVFVHFDPNDRLDPYVIHYMAALKASGLDIVLMSSSDLKDDAVAKISPMVEAVVCRQNLGHDFSGWALAIELFPDLLACEELIIANDSVYGPVGDLAAMFDRMNARPLDVWGVAESYDVDWHFQSWFVCFRKAALESTAFKSFWGEVRPLTDKRAIIESYEVPMLRTFRMEGLRVGTAVNCQQLGVTFGNPTAHTWRKFLELGGPFVKVQLLRDNPVHANLGGWMLEVDSYGYPIHLILDHLQRVAGKGAAGFQTPEAMV